MVKRYFIEIAYNGTKFHGWQVQPGSISIQSSVEDVLTQLNSQEKISVVGCGRTDAGVHANSYFFHVDLPFLCDDLLISKMNKMLPNDIVAIGFEEVSPEKHARFDAKWRTYRYFIHTKKDPFKSELSWFVSRPLNIDLMNEAASLLIGKQDFASFAKLHSDVKNTICEITHAQWEIKNDTLVFEICANRFLRNMVRAIVGTLLEVGQNKMSASEFKKVIAQQDRQAAALSVPAHGLFLWKIVY